MLLKDNLLFFLTPKLPGLLQKNLKKSSKLPREFWIVALIAFINSVSFTSIIPLIYPYARQFSLNDFEASLLISIYAVSQFIGTPILGKLSDRFARKPLLVISLLGTVLANFVASLATVAWVLIAARILDGLTGGNNSIAKAVISDMTNPAQRVKAFGIFSAVLRLGFVVGPALSYLAQQLPNFLGISSLGMSFLVSATIAFLATLITVFFLPETLSTKRGVKLAWQDFVFTKIFQAATRPKLGKIFILTFLSDLTFRIFTFAFQPFILEVLKQNTATLALIFSAIGIVGFTTQVLTLEPLTKKFNLLDLLVAAILGRAIVFLLIPTFPDLSMFAVLIVIFAVVNPFPLPLLSSLVSLNSSPAEQGEALGINSSYLSISNAIGPAISGTIVSNFGYRIPFWITGVLALLTALFAASLKAEFKHHKKH